MSQNKQIINLTYNYVVCGGQGYYAYGYRDIYDTDFSKYFEEQYDGIKGFVGRNLVKMCFSHQVNKYVHTPFSALVYPRLFRHSFHDAKPLCYVFFWRHRIIFESSYMDYLRRKHPGVKFVLFFQDIMRKYHDLDMDRLHNIFDLIITYDEGDARKYGLAFHPTPLILDVYRKCTAMGLKCDFIVMKVPDSAEREDGIVYSKRLLSYKENIQHIQKTKCILEIMQQGADGFTPRLWESIVYGKHLLTNNSRVRSSEFCYPDGNHAINSVDDGTISQLITQQVFYPASLCDSLSPVHLLSFIDQKLSAK